MQDPFDEPDSDAARDFVPEQPGHSSANVLREGDRLSIELPPLGFFRGSKGLGAFSLIWLAFNAIFGVFAAVIGVSAASEVTALPFILGLGFFVGIGVLLFVLALRSGRRRALLQVDGGGLSIVIQALGQPAVHTWDAGVLRSIGVGPSGIRVNDVPVMELQVRTHEGAKGFLRERRNDELEWIAAELRQALGLAPESSSGNAGRRR